MKKNNISYSLQEVADQLQISKRELIVWLRRYNFIKGMQAAPELVLMGYFTQHKFQLKHINKEVDMIHVTSKGACFLKKLRKVLKMDISSWI